MIKKYIKGNILKGREIAKVLYNLGAEDHYENCFEGNCLYFINSKTNRIDSVFTDSFFGELIIQSCEEILFKELYLSQEDLLDEFKGLSIEKLNLNMHFKHDLKFNESIHAADKIIFTRNNCTRIFKNRY